MGRAMSGLRKDLRDVLTANSVDSEGGIHSWRCWHPDRYPDYCHCVDELLDDLVQAVRDWAETQR